MKAAYALSVCILLGLATQTHAECAYPKAPDSMPNGSTASEQEMITAMTAFKQYNTDVESYLKCLDDETASKIKEAAGATSTIVQIKAIQSKKHNSAVDELQSSANKFNEQVRVFKSKNKK